MVAQALLHEHFQAALETPINLDEARHLLANQSHVYFWLGVACSALGQTDAALAWWMRAASELGDFQQMSVKQYSEMTFYSAMALKMFRRADEARSLLTNLQVYATNLVKETPKSDYFATSLPSILLCEEDLEKRNQLTARFLRAQAALGLDDVEESSRLLDEVLTADPNHGAASDLRQEMTIPAVFGSLQTRSLRL